MHEYSVAAFRFCSRLGSNPVAGHVRNFPCQSERFCQCCMCTHQLGHGLRCDQNLPKYDGEFFEIFCQWDRHPITQLKLTEAPHLRPTKVINNHNRGHIYFNIMNWNFFQNVLTSAGTFWMFAFMCIFNVIFTIAFIPETKGKTLEQIEATFRGTSGP